jgi:hypothetical protein
MNRIIILVILISKTLSGFSDVIFFPHQYAAFCYSAEFIYSLEKTKKSKNSSVLWGGIGCVGSFAYFDHPTYGLELALEKRHYFKSDKYKYFFISAYIGTAIMSDFKYAHDIGIVPGLKFNYKTQISQKAIFEPYLSLSLPIMYDFKEKVGFFPIPVLTIGVRFGLEKLINKRTTT